MDDNITLHDLRTRLDSLEYSLKSVCDNFMDCWIYDANEIGEDYCVCGCGNLPIANLLFRVKKSDVIRVYGLKIYPTRTCQMAIMNCDNRGQIIKCEIYEAVKKWVFEIPREQERQAARTDLIRRELIEHTSVMPEE